MVEELLQTLVGVVDAQLLECVVLTISSIINIVTNILTAAMCIVFIYQSVVRKYSFYPRIANIWNSLPIVLA